MSQVQFNLNISVVEPAPPLAEVVSSGDAIFTAGTAGSFILTGITGGVPPYQAAVDAASPNPLPDGLGVSIDADNNLVVSGTASAVVAAEPVLIDVTDSAGNSVLKATLNAATKGISAPPKPE